ncbi:hypothetical protein DL93DRAFT_2090513 [Clavulina sp. PMI_390]|nr:hypothetical protein DL93DRAFT_2090513 [Clavulina sp. PMI_390]
MNPPIGVLPTDWMLIARREEEKTTLSLALNCGRMAVIFCVNPARPRNEGNEERSFSPQ